jgi:intraflagellar transport protein 122
MWEYATQVASETNADVSGILKRKAQMQHDRNDLTAAAATYLEVGDFIQAVNIFGTNGALEKLIDIARKLKKSDSKALSRCLYFFRKHGHNAYAAECLVKMGDIGHLLSLYIDLKQWDDAFRIVETHPEYGSQLFLPYANWLAENDRYMEAQKNFRKAGRVDEAVRVLEQLAKNAVEEWRYDDAANYYWLLALENLDFVPDDADISHLDANQHRHLRLFYQFSDVAEAYFAYSAVRRYIDEPFTSSMPESLLNMSVFLINYMSRRSLPRGLSKSYVLFALSKLARNLGAFKLARVAYDRLQHVKLPLEWKEVVDVGSVTIRGKPAADKEDLQPVCFACTSLNPILNGRGDCCINCMEPFVRSFYSFSPLPLVEFALDDGLTDEEAAKILAKAASNDKSQNSSNPKTGSRSETELNQQLRSLERGAGQSFAPQKMNRQGLQGLRKSEVYIQDWGKRCIPKRYYRVVQTEMNVTQCPGCQRFFFDDEWNYQVLQKGSCSFCSYATAKGTINTVD